VFFHLFYDMFCFKVILNFQIGRRFGHFMGVPADWTELPFLETIHVRKSPAGWAPDDEVHDKEVMRVILIKIYRLTGHHTVLQIPPGCSETSTRNDEKEEIPVLLLKPGITNEGVLYSIVVVFCERCIERDQPCP